LLWNDMVDHIIFRFEQIPFDTLNLKGT
jgi:hypothetical protein